MNCPVVIKCERLRIHYFASNHNLGRKEWEEGRPRDGEIDGKDGGGGSGTGSGRNLLFLRNYGRINLCSFHKMLLRDQFIFIVQHNYLLWSNRLKKLDKILVIPDRFWCTFF